MQLDGETMVKSMINLVPDKSAQINITSDEITKPARIQGPDMPVNQQNYPSKIIKKQTKVKID